MKVLHVLYSGLGGHGNVFFSLVTADARHSFEHEALFNGVEDLREEYKERCARGNIRYQFVKKKPGLDIAFYKRLIKAITVTRPQVIFLHGSTQILWAKIAALLLRQKGILIVRETQANHLKTRQDWFWLAWALVLANKTVFLTEAYRQQIQQKLAWLYRAKKVTVISNGIDLLQYQPQAARTGNRIVFGMQSRIVKIKDHITLLLAFALLLQQNEGQAKNIFLIIAGDGDCRLDLEQLAKQLGIEQQVQFAGMLTEAQLVQFLGGLDVYVHASFGETMSTALMQAMACGLPVIASDVPGINNMIQDGITGLLVPVQNKEKMAAAMQLCLQNETYRTELAANALAFATTHYSNQRMFDAYQSIFKKQ